MDSAAMIGYIQPIAHVFSIAIDRNGFASKGLPDNGGDEFFLVLIRSVVVRTVGRYYRKSIGVEITSHDKIGRSFRCAIRTEIGRASCRERVSVWVV